MGARCGTLREAMSCAIFIVSSFHLESSCFYLVMFFLLTQMHSLTSVGGCKTLNSVGGWTSFSEISNSLSSSVVLYCTLRGREGVLCLS